MERNQDTAYIKNQLSVCKDDIQGFISHPPLQTELTDEMLIEFSNLPTVPSPPFPLSLPLSFLLSSNKGLELRSSCLLRSTFTN